MSFGQYEQDGHEDNGPEEIQWIVLDVKGDRALLVSRYILDVKEYCTTWNARQTDVTWESSTLRDWLNGYFLSQFTEEQRSAILETTVDNSKGQAFEAYSTSGGRNTEDRIFLLSYTEAWKYFATNADRIGEPTVYAVRRGLRTELKGQCMWWLRSPALRQNMANSVHMDGSRENSEVYVDYIGVRPAMWVNLGAKGYTPPARSDHGLAVQYEALTTEGETVMFGSYEQDNNLANGKEAIAWRVLQVKDGKSLLISKYALDCQPFRPNNGNQLKPTYVTWDTSPMRIWLNENFISSAFSLEETNFLLETRVDNSQAQSYELNKVDGGEDTDDRVFLLSYAEAQKYFGSDADRTCKPTAFAEARGATGYIPADSPSHGNATWWLRSPGGDRLKAAEVTFAGEIGYQRDSKFDTGNGIRPAFWIDTAAVAKLIEENPELTAAQSEVLYQADAFRKVGRSVRFGRYEQDNVIENGKEEIEWTVLEVEGNQVLLISRYALDHKAYNDKGNEQWENCSLRRWLNDEFLKSAFKKEERKAITVSEVENGDKQGYGGWGVKGWKDTQDQVFLLSYQETAGFFPNKTDRVCTATPYAIAEGVDRNVTWWLRSPGYGNCAALVQPNGDMHYNYYAHQNFAVRPVIRVDLSTDIFE